MFVGPNATFSNDQFPRSRQHPEHYARTLVRRGASIGANATILPGLTIGEKADGRRGRRRHQRRPAAGHRDRQSRPHRGLRRCGVFVRGALSAAPADVGVSPTRVAGVTLHRLPYVNDLRGNLSFGEVANQVPFEVKRYFLVYGVASKEIRGEHAHRSLHQFLICAVHGRCHVVADDGTNRQEFVLDSPTIGIHLPPMVWAIDTNTPRTPLCWCSPRTNTTPAATSGIIPNSWNS